MSTHRSVPMLLVQVYCHSNTKQDYRQSRSLGVTSQWRLGRVGYRVTSSDTLYKIFKNPKIVWQNLCLTKLAIKVPFLVC